VPCTQARLLPRVIGGPGGIDWSKEQLPDQTCGNHRYENESDGSGSKKPNVAERYGTVPFWKNGHVRPLPIVHPLNPGPKNVALASRFPALAGYLRSQAGRGRLQGCFGLFRLILYGRLRTLLRTRLGNMWHVFGVQRGSYRAIADVLKAFRRYRIVSLRCSYRILFLLLIFAKSVF